MLVARSGCGEDTRERSPGKAGGSSGRPVVWNLGSATGRVNGPLEGLVGSSEGAFGGSVQLMKPCSECLFHTQAETAQGGYVCAYMHTRRCVRTCICLFTDVLNSVCVGEQSCQSQGRWCRGVTWLKVGSCHHCKSGPSRRVLEVTSLVFCVCPYCLCRPLIGKF